MQFWIFGMQQLDQLEVTRVTTGWVTRGTRMTSASCVALAWQLSGSADVADDDVVVYMVRWQLDELW
jgi:hypothetical protein